MLNVSKQYIDAVLNSSRQFKARVLIDDVEYTTAKIENISYSSTICDGDKFVLGGGYTNTATISVLEIVEGVLELTPVKIYVSLLVNNTYTELPLGSFFVTEVLIDRNANKTTINVKDGMLRTEQPFNSQLIYPTTTRFVFEEIVSLLQVEVAPNISLKEYAVQSPLIDVTIKDALIYLAQLSGGFARFDRYGRLDIAKLHSNGRKISKSNYFLKGLTKNEIDFRIGGMKNVVKIGDTDKVMHSGKDNGIQVEFSNPLMTQNILDTVYDEYRRLNYYPFDLKWQGDVSLECVDWVSLEHGTDLWINVPLLSYNLTFNGGLTSTASAKASTQAQGEYAYKGVFSKKIEYMEAMLSDTNPIYLDIAEPQNAKNGAKWFKPNGGTVQLLEFIDGSWVKKADTADIGEIVNTFTTDEVIAKKLYGAIANFIEVNASKIVAGDIDLQRLRIMDGSKEVLAVRDNKLIVNFGDDLNIDAINEQLQHTLSQIDALRQQQKELQLDLIAKAAVEDLKRWQEDYENLVINYQADKATSEQALIASSQRVDAIQNNLGALGASLNFLTTYMRANEDGFFIGNKTSNTSFRVTNDRISLFSGGNEVMYITEGLIHIDNGIFTTTLQIGGYYRFEEYNPKSNDHNLILRYLGTQGGRLNV